MRCQYCNWTPHDVSLHEDLCPKGHPIEIVGFYVAGQQWPVCRACQRDRQRRYELRRSNPSWTAPVRRLRDGAVKRAFLKYPRGWRSKQMVRLANMLSDARQSQRSISTLNTGGPDGRTKSAGGR